MKVIGVFGGCSRQDCVITITWKGDVNDYAGIRAALFASLKCKDEGDYLQEYYVVDNILVHLAGGEFPKDPISSADAGYLKGVIDHPFNPIGQVYGSIFEGLRERGLVSLDINGYIITARGKKALEFHR